MLESLRRCSVAVGAAPGDYASRTEVQHSLSALREYLGKRRGSQSLHNRAILSVGLGEAAVVAVPRRPESGRG